MIIKEGADEEKKEGVIYLRNSAVQANLEVDKELLRKLMTGNDGHDQEQLEEAAIAKAMGGSSKLY